MATAWGGMLAVLLAMWMLLRLLCLNVLLQVAVHIGQSPTFRTGVLGVATLYAGFFAVLLFKGEKPGLHILLDLINKF